MRIEVGYGLEGTLTDAISSSILSQVVAPRFREGRVADGIAAGLDAIDAAIKGEYRADGRRAVARRLAAEAGAHRVHAARHHRHHRRRAASTPRTRAGTAGPAAPGGWGGGARTGAVGSGASAVAPGGSSGGGFSGGGGSFGGGGSSGDW